jgi:hypothetical protein
MMVRENAMHSAVTSDIQAAVGYLFPMRAGRFYDLPFVFPGYTEIQIKDRLQTNRVL